MSTSTIPYRTSLLALCALSAGLLSTSCMQKPLCEELGDCGGAEPLGTWQLAPGYPSCLEDLYVPATDPRLLGAEVPPARAPAIEPALYDWCYMLVTGGAEDAVRRPPRFYYESGPVGWASITYKGVDPMTGIRNYTIGLTRTGTFILDFPAVCIRSFGLEENQPVRDMNGNVVAGPSNACKQIEVQIGESGLGEGSYSNVICNPNAADPEGCLCQFDVSEAGGGGGGTYEISGSTIRHEPTGTTTSFPQFADYCNKSGSLELTGHDGTYLFGVKGLRTMSLLKAAAPPAAPPP